MAVVTISYELGTSGPELGQILAERLGYRHVDRELISEAARRYGCLEDKLSHLTEAKPTFFERFDSETRRYITVTQTLVYEFAAQDDVVLMRRAGQWLLRGIPHVLRVRVMAPFDLRVQRLAARLAAAGRDVRNQRAVADMVRHDDAELAGRMRYLYDVDLKSPSLYEVTLNDAFLGVEAAVDLLTGLVRRPEMAATEAGRQLVADRLLASRVQLALGSDPEARRTRVTVEAKDGVVTLEGSGSLERAVELARAVPGVRDVVTRPVEIPPIPPFVA